MQRGARRISQSPANKMTILNGFAICLVTFFAAVHSEEFYRGKSNRACVFLCEMIVRKNKNNCLNL